MQVGLMVEQGIGLFSCRFLGFCHLGNPKEFPPPGTVTVIYISAANPLAVRPARLPSPAHPSPTSPSLYVGHTRQ